MINGAESIPLNYLVIFNEERNMKRCKKCKIGLNGKSYHGTKKWYGWIYWCVKCSNENFYNMVESNPILLDKYYGIHGKKPREVI